MRAVRVRCVPDSSGAGARFRSCASDAPAARGERARPIALQALSLDLGSGARAVITTARLPRARARVLPGCAAPCRACGCGWDRSGDRGLRRASGAVSATSPLLPPPVPPARRRCGSNTAASLGGVGDTRSPRPYSSRSPRCAGHFITESTRLPIFRCPSHDAVLAEITDWGSATPRRGGRAWCSLRARPGAAPAPGSRRWRGRGPAIGRPRCRQPALTPTGMPRAATAGRLGGGRPREHCPALVIAPPSLRARLMRRFPLPPPLSLRAGCGCARSAARPLDAASSLDTPTGRGLLEAMRHRAQSVALTTATRSVVGGCARARLDAWTCPTRFAARAAPKNCVDETHPERC